MSAARLQAALRWGLASALALGLELAADTASARQFGFQSPAGRRIYRPRERFDEVLEHKRRVVVSEVALGAGPEGNIAMLLGCLNFPVRRLDLFAGLGIEANPAALFTGSGRYTFNFDGIRPYVALGYLYKLTYEVGVASHNVYAEVGHTWIIHRTLRFSLGVGLRRILDSRLTEDSPLNGPDTDRAAVDRELIIHPYLASSVEERVIMAEGTGCRLRDVEGRPYDLRKFVDPNAVFITEKSSGGKSLKALEHPGLWNGAMARWTTVFVEVPPATFNPVKTINDLLLPEHQPGGEARA